LSPTGADSSTIEVKYMSMRLHFVTMSNVATPYAVMAVIGILCSILICILLLFITKQTAGGMSFMRCLNIIRANTRVILSSSLMDQVIW
jgi:hypothetical protein